MGGLSPLDPSSFSRPELSIVRHVSLSLNVDFDKKILTGIATLNVDVLQETNELILDVSNLSIESVEDGDGIKLSYNVGDEIPTFGSKLTINLPKATASGEKLSDNAQEKANAKSEYKIYENLSPRKSSKALTITFNGFFYEPSKEVFEDKLIAKEDKESCGCCVCKKRKENIVCGGVGITLKIKYSTAPNASGLQWLDPEQTSGKKHPYLFSQCQPIHARSILPCQDTPYVKFTYDAEVTAPPEFTVLMSALRGAVNGNVTSFNQPMPLPAYLVAIAVGSLESRSLGPRSKVWSEKEEIERSVWEFAETEKYLQAAERLCGPYVWGQYDLLVLPPSFPYGGMENPCLTFVTPTLLAGDRSLADVIVHEIMHSWTGNLVTNRNFEHFWLNEGFTVFLERKVGASLIADKEEARKSRDFHSILGLQELSETVNDELGSENPLTRLVVDLKGVHPDDAFSTVPYEKGSLFLRVLEDMVGGAEVFDEFLRSYLNHFAKKSLDTDQFKAFLLEYFKDNENLKTVDWNAWLNQSGMPPVIPDYDTSMTKAVTALVAQISSNATISPDDVRTLTPHQMINFLQTLVDNPTPLPLPQLQTMGVAYGLAKSKNAEIEYRWLRLCVRSNDIGRINDVFKFVNSQGRMKYLRPMYRDLYAWEPVRQRAIDNFLANEKYMMHVSAYTLRKDLHLLQ